MPWIFFLVFFLSPENSHELPRRNCLSSSSSSSYYIASSFGLSLVIMEVVGEPPFSSSLRRVSSRCLSTFVFSLRGLSRLPSPSGSGWVSVHLFSYIWCIGREGVMSVAPLVRTRRPSPNHQTLSFASLRLKLRRTSSVFRVERKKRNERIKVAQQEKKNQS